MTDQRGGQSQNLDSLQKRAGELNCLYRIKDILRADNKSIKNICSEIAAIIPLNMTYPEDCHVKIIIDQNICTTKGFQESSRKYCKDITFRDNTLGSITLYYVQDHPVGDSGPFFKEEIRLIDTIAGLLGQYVISLNIKKMVMGANNSGESENHGSIQEWPALVEMLKHTNRELYYRICRKILNVLNWEGNDKVRSLLKTINSKLFSLKGGFKKGTYYSTDQKTGELPSDINQVIIETARTYISDDIMLQHIQNWLQEEKLGYLAQVVNRNLSLEEVADSIRRYYEMAPADQDIRFPSKWGIQISLIRRFLSEQTQYINIAKHLVDIKDFKLLLKNMVFSAESRGKLGGKSAILFLIDQIIRKELQDNKLFNSVKIPKTWFISSDVVYHFMHYNNFDDVVEQKYKNSDQIRLEYPQIVESFIEGQFPEDIIKKLSAALDDLHDKPLIVRSSSLLENQIGSTFFGKYKSILLVNKGTKRNRLHALMRAIAEVYASTFSPVPLEHRRKNDLLDFGEEMGIMIQEVVGTSVGSYYLPLCSGIAYSDNVYRWSGKIKSDDGLICLSPGFRIRPEDHKKSDLPVLMVPGNRDLDSTDNLHNTPKHLPKNIIVIDTEKGQVVQVDADKFLREFGPDIPGYQEILSVVKNNRVEKILKEDLQSGDIRVTFRGINESNPVLDQINAILKLLKDKLGMPVDVEFTYDGVDLYILQCRSYNYLRQNVPVPIPHDIPNDQIIFFANRYVMNGILPEIKYIIYIDPLQYRDRLSSTSIIGINQLIQKLNKTLPRKQFMVMAPWTFKEKSETDYGIDAALSDIDNSAALIELSVNPINNVPECSFDPYFFHDLINNDIQYFVLKEHDERYPLNIGLLKGATNIMADISPEDRQLFDIIKLIDLRKEANGQVLRISMNAELNEALGYLTKHETEISKEFSCEEIRRPQKEDFWRWRLRMVEKIASKLDAKRFGVKNFYLFGSTKNASAGPCSDIDLLIHHDSTAEQLHQLKLWLEGWSLCLDEMNYLKTGYHSDGLLDVQFITDEDLEKKTSFAAMVNAVTDRARRITLKDADSKD